MNQNWQHVNRGRNGEVGEPLTFLYVSKLPSKTKFTEAIDKSDLTSGLKMMD